VVALAAATPAAAESLRYCDRPAPASAEQHDRLLRFAAVVKAELDRSGRRVALLSRSGLDLSRFGVRYSHAGLALLASTHAPWAVRQLYFACDEQRPRIFDQGIPGFVLGTHDAAAGFVSAVLLPTVNSHPVERTALDDAAALSLLGGSYSANAYPFSTRHQNCNQWLAELLALAWGAARDRPPREAAQAWLQAEGFAPTAFDVGSRLLMWLGLVIPWLHADDHPADDLERAVYRVAMPASIESLARRAAAGAERIEFCHDNRHIVVRRGWQPIADGCEPEPGDEVRPW